MKETLELALFEEYRPDPFVEMHYIYIPRIYKVARTLSLRIVYWDEEIVGPLNVRENNMSDSPVVARLAF